MDEQYPHRRDNLFWGLISAALLSGAGSGVLTVTQTADRYHAEDAARDFALVHERIHGVRERLERLEKDVQRIDVNGPAVGNEFLRRTVEGMERRIDELEKQ